MGDSICTRCFHKDVCEQANENGQWGNKNCHYFNSHFVAADSVEPVRHGKWIRNVLFAGTHTCSNCLKDPNHFDGAVGYIEILSDYCPNCGAKMDEEEPNELD